MSPPLRYDNQVAIVTGAGNGLGRQYALFLASRGAKVVVNDLGQSFNGSDSERRGDARVADLVVKEIRDGGGIAVPNYDPVQEGHLIVKTAIDAFGRVDILINNAGILRDCTLRNMKHADWHAVLNVHVHGTYKTTRAAWPYMQKQNYGRIICTSSAAGLYGNFGQSNYAAAKMALVGFGETLAKEGAKNNIISNVLAPAAASRMTQTVWSQDLLDVMKPDWVVPLVGFLVHEQCRETGSIFAAAAGHYSKIRWERSKGFLANPTGLTTEAVLQNWDKVVEWKGAEHPKGPAPMLQLFQKANALSIPTSTSPKINFENRVVLVTGGGGGPGRAYSLLFAKLGAKVVVNDTSNADHVANEIKSLGGNAVPLAMSVEEGGSVVQKVMETYGRIDIVINNAGVLRDNHFTDMTDEEWCTVMNTDLCGTYLITRAAFPIMVRQKYGRIVNIVSTSGIYGSFGQANSATATCGMIGFTKTIAREGAKYNIIVNALASAARTNQASTAGPGKQADPDYVAPIVAALCAERPLATGQIFESGGGWIAATRWQRARGYDFEPEKGIPSVEQLAEVFSEICNFDNGKADNPDTPQEGSRYTMGNALKNSKLAGMTQENPAHRKYIAKIQAAKQREPTITIYDYDQKDIASYNLSLGAGGTDFDLSCGKFHTAQVLPTFGALPSQGVSFSFNDIVPNYDQRMIFHREHYLEIDKFPIPKSGNLKTESRLIEVVDEGKDALVRRGDTTFDASGKRVFYNETVLSIRGSGGFGGQKRPADRGFATAINSPPSRTPDRVLEEKTSHDVATQCWLFGDRDPTHLNPDPPVAAAIAGGSVHPLHEMASFGITGKHVFQAYGPFNKVKVRFSGLVLQGQTIVTEMWKEGGRIVYQARVKESGTSLISNAAVELLQGVSKL
ncbi:hypothetical protein CERZMDRAFT_101103 [Cercospora zeae-maydis SCOH1-5]|uniref:Ketoreductase domain-containing protein n=1 Tax=Cercospora zeae-maydis SCOH1-5 TaxID=717836 RepID=A0A6A6F5F1_9PEZI|nr:hypothetical protein CERZMDRAFT_101103 [Cercospora zeae-maydis SCOH1-5]